MPKEYKDLVVGLDIGTAKVMVVVAEVLSSGALKLAGLGVAPSNGLKRGVVVNIDATVQSIQQALKEAELMADWFMFSRKTLPSSAVHYQRRMHKRSVALWIWRCRMVRR